MMSSEEVFGDDGAESCPDCGGELKYQTEVSVLCDACGECFEHWIEGGTDTLYSTPDAEVVHRA